MDTTPQYSLRFPPPENPGVEFDTMLDFLDSEQKICVYTPGDDHPIREANRLSRRLFDWARGQPGLESGQMARCIVLFEEAQNFIPEGFVVEGWDLKTTAQDTSRLIYGESEVRLRVHPGIAENRDGDQIGAQPVQYPVRLSGGR